MLPLALALTAHSAEIEGLPRPAPPRPMTFAEPQEKTLSNGLRVVAIERPGLPLLTATLLGKAGAEMDPAERAGLASFTAGMLMRGSTTRSATQIAQDLEVLGASLATGADWDTTSATLTTLAGQAEPALAILAEVVRRPAFAKAEIERLRKERIDERQIELEQPTQLARAAAYRAILGASPYAHPVAGTPASLRRIQRADLAAQHARIFRPDNAVLICAGDLAPASAFALAEKLFGDWQNPAPEKKPTADQPERPAPAAILIDMPDAGQAAVYVGCAAAARSSGDYAVGQIANAVLGGGYSARLNREIRIKRGLSYGCGSKLLAWRGAGIFGAACQTKNESAAEVVRVMQAELQKLGAAPAGAEEFTARRLVLTGAFERELETNAGYVARAADLIVHGEPPGAFAGALERLRAVTPEEAQAFAAKQLAAEAMTVVVVGRAKDCEKPLRELFPKLRVIPQAKVDLEHAGLGGRK
jgi:zinc protease